MCKEETGEDIAEQMALDEGHGACELFQAQTHIYKHCYHYVDSMALKCAVQLGIPDMIHKHDKPITLTELISELHVHPTKASFLQRLMRMLVHSGFFATRKISENQEEEEEGYVLTPTSKLLLKDNVTSLSPFVQAMLDPILIVPWLSLGDWFLGTESVPFETAHGMSFWDYVMHNHEFSKFLSEAMASDSRTITLVVGDHKEIFEGLDSLVDVGGGTGTLARAIAEAFPHITCTVLDLPSVIANQPENKSLKFVGGDMFQSIPPADAIIIKSTLHNWSDEDCIKILKQCRVAISTKGKGGKVMIIDVVINEKKDDKELTKTKLYVDMAMMLICTGRERNEKDFEKLIMEAGFSHYKITPLFGLRSLIEIYP
ncbi:trans-resveratrol di-O-methyltransferase-like [Tripterygium wilfordii]|uniref:Trans-resveratrol di-O-methyltransferase-like n=1 Tax=Tripterygium wilfordii TaxID=458696 RepID=A0A7J7C5N0_TRIWF|nr:trans-resveratrol di-O-methyltransferase-like [Tripterygium wilfordii]KAF5729127.1 trans-resveratrol di-O-methyltransferase-like [Tripterygium wilfordii]